MISERYTRWVAMLASSDRNLVLLALIAVGLVVAWRLAPRLPAPWAERGRRLFLVSTGLLVAQMVTQIQISLPVLLLGGLLASLAVAVARWVRLGRLPAAEAS